MVTLAKGCTRASAASFASSHRLRPLIGRKRCNQRTKMQTRRSIELALSSQVSSASPQQQTFTCFEDSSFIYCHNNSNTTLSSSPHPKPGNGTYSCLEDASSPNTTSSDSFLSSSSSSSQESNRQATLAATTDLIGDVWNTSGSIGCISALDYWHLGSSSDSYSDYCSSTSAPQQANRLEPQSNTNTTSATQNHLTNNLNHLHQQHQQHCSLAGQDPVYLEDEKVFHNLLLRESGELKRRPVAVEQPLKGSLRHLLLSWMLKVCEHQLCQDEIFPLATMILDKFLLFKPTATLDPLSKPLSTQPACKQVEKADQEEKEEEEEYADEEELAMRQIYLFAACALLLATKLRQTPRLSVHTLTEFSKRELPIELRKEEIIEGELLLLATLKWDLVSLVAPNDFLAILISKCRCLLLAQRAPANEEGRVLRHTQSLLELCLMDSKLSRYAPSVLAMSSLAVAIDGLSVKEKSPEHLTDMVTQIHEATHKANELKTMIDVAIQIEKYVQTLLTSTIHD